MAYIFLPRSVRFRTELFQRVVLIHSESNREFHAPAECVHHSLAFAFGFFSGDRIWTWCNKATKAIVPHWRRWRDIFCLCRVGKHFTPIHRYVLRPTPTFC